jgi:hypothetical protein
VSALFHPGIVVFFAAKSTWASSRRFLFTRMSHESTVLIFSFIYRRVKTAFYRTFSWLHWCASHKIMRPNVTLIRCPYHRWRNKTVRSAASLHYTRRHQGATTTELWPCVCSCRSRCVARQKLRAKETQAKDVSNDCTCVCSTTVPSAPDVYEQCLCSDATIRDKNSWFSSFVGISRR